MEFTGAVLVCNKKITNAIENYREIEKEWDDIWIPIVKGLIDEYKELSWWKKFWHDGSAFGVYDYQYVMCIKYGAKVNGKFDSVEKNLLNAGLITQEIYGIFETYFNSYDHSDTLEVLVKCGEPVYLNPQQASFVNKFYKEEI